MPARPAPERRRARRLLPLLAACLALAASACTTSAPEQPVFSTEVQDVSMQVDGRERTYRLQPALDLAPGARSALVVVLHQEGATLETVVPDLGLADLRRSGATLVYPAGIDTSWDAGKCCGTPQRQHVDDVAFLDAVLADVPDRAAVDSDRVAVVGYSSGAMLAYRYLCQGDRTLSAAVLVSGSLESECSKDITGPEVLAVHGKLDGTIGLTASPFVNRLGLSPRPLVSSLGILSRRAGCPEDPTTEEGGRVEVRTWSDCRGGRSITALLVEDEGHGWRDLDGAERTADFLTRNVLAG